MCARTGDEQLVGRGGNDVTSARMTSSEELPVARDGRYRRPATWRYSLPAAVSPPPAARPVAPTHISGADNEPVSGLRRRPLGKYIGATGSRKSGATGDGEPRFRPTCLRYSYWLTLDDSDRRSASKYSSAAAAAALELNGYRNQLRTRFRPRSCEVINDARGPASCRIASPPRNGEIDPVKCHVDHPVLRRHLTSGLCHVTGSSATPSPACRTAMTRSQADVDSDHSADCVSLPIDRTDPTMCLNNGNDRFRRCPENATSTTGSDVIVDRCASRDETEGQGRMSLCKIGDSGLGTSMHSDQASPDDVEQQQQQHIDRRLSDDDLDDAVDESQGHCQCQSSRQGQDQGQEVRLSVDNEDISTRLTRHKLRHRCLDDLSALVTTFNKQIQCVSHQLVELLQERLDLRQQVDMRKIAVDQLRQTLTVTSDHRRDVITGSSSAAAERGFP